MAILIGDVHDFIRGILKKNKGGFVSPKDIDRAVNRAVSDFCSSVISKFQQGGKFSYDHFLVKRKKYTVSPTTTVNDIPTDYAEGLTIYISDSGVLKEGEILSYDEFLERTNSVIVSPSTSYPIATIYVNESGVSKIEFMPAPPTGSYDFTLVYMKKPATAVYDYSQSNGNISQNVGASVNVDLDDRYFSDIATRALVYLGVSLRDQDVASLEGIRDNNQKQD